MIKVGKPVLCERENNSRLSAIVDVDGEKTEIWFEVDKEYGKYLCYERSDSFFVILFYYAMKNGHDMEFEGEISEQLYYGLKCNLMKAIADADLNFYDSKIICKTTDQPIASENKAATGISCGVDSLSAVYAHVNGQCPDGYELDYLTFFNGGAAYHANGVKALTKDGEDIEKKRIINAKQVADAVKLPLIVVDSNISEFLKIDYAYTHTFRNCAMAMVLQKLFSKYYYASAGFKYRDLSIMPERAAGYYDCFSLHYISNGVITFYSCLDYCSRMDKVKMIADYLIAQKYLNVCVMDGENCGKCPKCRRTIVALDAIEKLEKFSEVFDIDYYKKNRRQYLLNVVKNSDEYFIDDIYKLLNEQKKISIDVLIQGKLLMFLKRTVRCIRRGFRGK